MGRRPKPNPKLWRAAMLAQLAHLKRASSGHLLKASSGHLSKGCPSGTPCGQCGDKVLTPFDLTFSEITLRYHVQCGNSVCGVETPEVDSEVNGGINDTFTFIDDDFLGDDPNFGCIYEKSFTNRIRWDPCPDGESGNYDLDLRVEFWDADTEKHITVKADIFGEPSFHACVTASSCTGTFSASNLIDEDLMCDPQETTDGCGNSVLGGSLTEPYAFGGSMSLVV